MGRYRKSLKRLVNQGITSPPPCKYSLRHERQTINYVEDLNKTLSLKPTTLRPKKCLKRTHTVHVEQEDKENLHSASQYAAPCRISSSQAADLIQNSRMDEEAELLVISTDASATRYTSGAAAIIRQCGKATDQVKTALKYISWAESSPAEVAAVALACDVALEENLVRRWVLIIVDATAALDFYDPLVKNRLETDLVDGDAYKLSMSRLVQMSLQVMIAKVRSNKTNSIGFFDHDAADHLANVARGKSKAASFEHEWVYGVPCLARAELDWLRCSVHDTLPGERNELKESCRGELKESCRVRLHSDFGIEI